MTKFTTFLLDTLTGRPAKGFTPAELAREHQAQRIVIPRILSGAAELEIDFYRDLYDLGIWWALLSGYDRETRARRVLERSLYNVEGFREAFDREAAKGGEFFDIIDRILHKADRACKEWSQYEYEENKRDRAEDAA